MTTQDTRDTLQKFIFDNAAVRGELVEISDTWREIQARHAYPKAVRTVLGEMVAAASLLSANLKFNGMLVMQMHGDGPVRLQKVPAIRDPKRLCHTPRVLPCLNTAARHDRTEMPPSR